MRLSPLDPLFGQMQAATALAEFCAGRFIEASSWAQKAAHALQNWPLGLGIAAASCALAGRPEEAKSAAERLRQLIPTLKPSDLANFLGSADRRTVRHSKKACAKPDCLNNVVMQAPRSIRSHALAARPCESRLCKGGQSVSVPTLCTGAWWWARFRLRSLSYGGQVALPTHAASVRARVRPKGTCFDLKCSHALGLGDVGKRALQIAQAMEDNAAIDVGI